MKSVIFYCFCFISFTSMAIDAKEVLNKMTEVYESLTVYEFSLRYDMFKGEKSTNVEESYEGYFVRNKNNSYQKIGTVEFISTPSFCLKISPEEEVVEMLPGQNFKNQNFDWEQTINECKDLILEELDNHYLITMNLKSSSQVPYRSVKLVVNRSNFHLEQVDMFYWQMEDFSKNPTITDFETPHLRITYSDLRKKTDVKDELFTLETYFTKTNNTISPSGSIKGYELLDYRK